MRKWIGLVFVAFGMGLGAGSGIGLTVAGMTADKYGLNGFELAGPSWIGALIAVLAILIGLMLTALRPRSPQR